MGHRLSKIVTRTGDSGTTGLGDGSRVPKDSARIDAIGGIDELNSTLGLLLAEPLPHAVAACLTSVQHDLFDLGGELSIPGHVARHRRPRRSPRGGGRSLQCRPRCAEGIRPSRRHAGRGDAHVARTVCRRAERTLVRMAATESVSTAVRRYVNRLSDLLFVLARALNRAAGTPDVLWRKNRPGESG